MAVSPRTLTSPHPVLPPIVTTAKDQRFLDSLHRQIERELQKVDSTNPEQRYVVHKDAFDKIIDYVTAYKPLLTAIKAEYEDCIETILRGQREAFYLSGKLKAMATEPSTIHNYRKRGDDLELKIHIIADDNEKLQEEVKMLKEARLEKESKARETDKPPVKELKRDKRHIPGLTLQQSTDPKVLKKEMEKLERQIKELNISHKTRFSSKEIKDNLKEQLSQKVTLRDQLSEQTTIQRHKRHKLNIAVEAARAYMKLQPPHQSIGEAVVNALSRAGSQGIDKGISEEQIAKTTPSNTFEDDDPTREKEAELMLEYIEKFNELLEDRKYEEAAIHAANSPKGILRTQETLHRFQDLEELTAKGRPPLLAFCDALMSTVSAYQETPGDYLSVECVNCALEENRLDLLTHWLSQDWLTLTQHLGDLIVEFGSRRTHVEKQCMSLAQKVYININQPIQAMQCMVKQGRIGQAVEYAQKLHLPSEECMAVLASNISPQLCKAMYDTKVGGKRLLPLGQVAHTLVTHGAATLGVQFVRYIQQQGDPDNDQRPSMLRNAVFEDELTTEEQWQAIVEACQDVGFQDTAIDVLAAVTVISSVRKATHYMEEMERQRVEEERQKQMREELSKAKKKERRKKRRKFQKDKEETEEGVVGFKNAADSDEEFVDVNLQQ